MSVNIIKKILNPTITSPFKNNLFLNKNVLITGGGTGLGKQIAKTYLNLGASVIIASRKEEVLKNTCLELGNERIDYHILDLKKTESIANLVSNLRCLPDIVINNSAGNFICPSEDLTYNGWNSILDIVLKGTTDLTLTLGKEMIKQSHPASFINISTTYAGTGSGFVVPSAISKAGCDNLTKSLAAEWGKYGLRFNSIAPGPIYTEGAFSRLDPSGEFVKNVTNVLPLGRLGEKEELANLVCFITSDHMSWITGQIINFDGGETVGNSGEFNFLNKLKKQDWLNLKSKM